MNQPPQSPRFLPQFLQTPAVLWQLMQTLWLGAHLAALLLFMPMLVKIGFAPLLLQEVQGQLRPALLVFTLLATAVQMMILVRTSGLSALGRQLRGQLLLASWSLALIVLLGYGKALLDESLIRGLYGALLGCGLLLITQPLPEKNSR